MDRKQHREKLNKFIINFLDRNKFITKEENIFHMEKAFMAASVLRHALKREENKKIDAKTIKIYFRALGDYKLGRIDLIWDKDNIKFGILDKTEDEGEGDLEKNEQMFKEITQAILDATKEEEDQEPDPPCAI